MQTPASLDDPPSRWKSFDILSRLRAMGVHVGLSCLVAALVAVVVFGLWYPSPFREISGGRELFTLVVTFDVILGPLITFAIFNRRKSWRELRRDLAIVTAVQLAGLAYGMYTVWVVRPAYVVFEVDRFVVIRAIDVDQETLERAPAGLRRLPVLGPEFIGALPPVDPGEAAESLRLVAEGRDISTQPATWRPYETAVAALLKRAQPLEALRRLRPAHAADIDALVRSTGLSRERLVFLPIISRESHWVAVLDNQDAKVLGYLPFGGF